MKKLYYAIIVLLLIGLISCGDDDETVQYNSNDFVGYWNVVSTSIEFDIFKGELNVKVLNDTLSLISDGTTSVSSTVYKNDGTFDYYIRTILGTWNYSVDSNYINVVVEVERLDINGELINDGPYNINGKVNKLTPKLVVQKYVESIYGNHTVIKELIKINKRGFNKTS